MPIIKATDLAYARVRVPDLDRAEAFMNDFGLLRSARTDKALYMRGACGDHHIYVAELGPSKFLSLAFVAGSEDDLRRIAGLLGASDVETIEEPGGGRRVRIQDPDGNTIEVVHGIERVQPIDCRCQPLNDARDGLRRAGTPARHEKGPARVLRLGHGVLASPNMAPMLAWYRETLGLLLSDEVRGPDNEIVLSFNRLDRGAEYVDHHVFLLQHGPSSGLNHVAFEVQDFDDLMLGHEHMKARAHDSVWGVGRHVYGAQIFDYWMDPFDFMYEHWTDTDRMNADFRGVLDGTIESANGPWGAQVPERFFTHSHE
ncbi:catechol 1,2-dioxygenase [Variovorax sp. WS11]|uniref:VOC family protein n=1 Tax=Variovorax sp. WS11 TaxID=1105204 RepID=UPI000D0D5CB4|nr:VOC family protein [Variovorax sp. WS11]NDZ17335.1 catechol 1,2-dioxygenase [Variovorax sp. WS11]PSL86125.1 catechol 1,2-dioxygenase [Variovorax sp. WS11]